MEKRKFNRKSKVTSLVLPNTLKSVITDKSSDENLTEAAFCRKLIIAGLNAEYGIVVRNNEVLSC